MAKHHDIWVLTRTNNRKVIEEELEKHPISGLNFIYYDLPKWASWWKKGGHGIQLYYMLWQLLAGCVVKTMKFDCCHHLTFNQYRTFSFAYLKKCPLIIGPVGGGELIPLQFFRDLKLLTRFREWIRILGVDRLLVFVASRIKRGSLMYIFSNTHSKNRVVKWVKKDVSVLSSIGINPENFPARKNKKSQNFNDFNFIYAGRANDWKGIYIFLLSLSDVKKNMGLERIKLSANLIGISSNLERKKIQRWVKKLDLLDEVTLTDFMPRNDLIQLMNQSFLSVYPAFRDSGSMSVLESCALGCPVICFDTPGQDVFPNDILCKIPIKKSYAATQCAFSEKLLWAIQHPIEIHGMGQRARKYVLSEMNWSAKVMKISACYLKLIGDN